MVNCYWLQEAFVGGFAAVDTGGFRGGPLGPHVQQISAVGIRSVQSRASID
eukprot:SAG11_NODE_2805_length_2952_cov_2.120575_1_plen_51_part_00